MDTQWEIRSEIMLPMGNNIRPGEPFPPKLEFTSRFPEEMVTTVGLLKLILQNPNRTSHNVIAGYEPKDLVVILSATDGSAALDDALQYIEWVCDLLAFSMQYPVPICNTEVRQRGDDRRVSTIPGGFQPAKFRVTSYLGNAEVLRTPALSDVPEQFTEKDHAALRWYHKALAATYEIDKFIFFWIALEILCGVSSVVVKAKYVADCGHTIDSCPQCGRSTERQVKGSTLRKFLSDELGIEDKRATELWEFRQMLHGNNKLTAQDTERMSNVIMVLQSAVNLAIKRRLGIPDGNPPIVKPEGIAFSAFRIGLEKADPSILDT